MTLRAIDYNGFTPSDNESPCNHDDLAGALRRLLGTFSDAQAQAKAMIDRIEQRYPKAGLTADYLRASGEDPFAEAIAADLRGRG